MAPPGKEDSSVNEANVIVRFINALIAMVSEWGHRKNVIVAHSSQILLFFETMLNPQSGRTRTNTGTGEARVRRLGPRGPSCGPMGGG